MSLSTLLPELLFLIFSFLDDKDLPRLSQTCRHLYRATHPRLRKLADETTLLAISKAERTGIWTVPIGEVRSLDGFEDRFSGFRAEFTKTDIENKTSKDVQCHNFGFFIDAIVNGVKSGKTNVTNATLIISKLAIYNKNFQPLFCALKRHSYTRSISEFSITSLVTYLRPLEATHLFDVTKLTKLSLTFPQQLSSDKGVLDDITNLKDLFKGAHNLEELILNPSARFKGPKSVKDISQELEELKEEFRTLRRLHTFKLDIFLFHPSFFLPMPESVKTLSLGHIAQYTKSWWAEFAKYPFKNLEHLNFTLCETDHCFNISGLATHLCTEDPPFVVDTRSRILGDVEIRGLKRLTCQRMEKPYLPMDLIPCIMKRNPGLDEDVKQTLSIDYSRALVSTCKEELAEAMKCGMYDTETESEVGRRYLVNGPREDDLQRCAVEYLSKFLDHLKRQLEPGKPGHETI
ncbi:hypothetical protein TWF281_006864 [Arthrobotrys megalospora]